MQMSRVRFSEGPLFISDNSIFLQHSYRGPNILPAIIRHTGLQEGAMALIAIPKLE